MAKPKIMYICSECGYRTLRPMNRCPRCREFKTFHPEQKEEALTSTGKTIVRTHEIARAVPLSSVRSEKRARYQTGIRELDTVLGGGLVSDSAVLIGGDPGIGKSTLLLQVCSNLSFQTKVLYVSAEESEGQIQMRAQRLGVQQDTVYVCAENDIRKIVSEIELLEPGVIVMDSIQTIYSPEVGSAPGSVAQVREATSILVGLAKRRGAAIFIVGHVTKEGSIAGPKVLEHLVDTVLYFEGEKYDSLRVLRAQKNRFGSTNEIGVFEMMESGFREVRDPSGVFLDHSQDTAGCCVSCIVEGTRAILVETQALVAGSPLGTPRISSTGLDRGRLAQLMAVMDKKCGIRMAGFDVYTNVVGGMKLSEPAIDLALAATLVSSLEEKPVRAKTVVTGEVSLTGEIRSIPHIEKRIGEAEKLGFEEIVLPKANYDTLITQPGALSRWKRIRLVPVSTLAEGLEHLF